MYKCLNRRCQAPVLQRGHCPICTQIREDTIAIIKEYFDMEKFQEVGLPN